MWKFSRLLLLYILIKNISISAENKSPNILLLIIDDLRTSLGCYGDEYAVTPNIDNLASNGVIFGQAYAQQALCGPSRTSFLTTRRPDTLKLTDVHHYWRRNVANFTTLPEYFKKFGYDTQSVGKVFHPGIVSGHTDDQPYSWTFDPYHPSTQKYKNSKVCRGDDGLLHTNVFCPVKIKDQPEKSLPDIQSTEFAVKWLKNRRLSKNSDQLKSSFKNKNKFNQSREAFHNNYKNFDQSTPPLQNKPFFLAVGFHKPHIPLKFPKPFLDLFPIDSVPLPAKRKHSKRLPTVAWNPWNDLRWREDVKKLNLTFPFASMPDFYAKRIIQGYYASVTYIDALISVLLRETKNLFPDTIVTLISDHGWSLGEHGEWSKFSNFEVSTRVPFIVSLPKDDQNGKIPSANYLNQDIFTNFVQDTRKIDQNRKINTRNYLNRDITGFVPDTSTRDLKVDKKSVFICEF